jgi:hypothetical protein
VAAEVQSGGGGGGGSVQPSAQIPSQHTRPLPQSAVALHAGGGGGGGGVTHCTVSPTQKLLQHCWPAGQAASAAHLTGAVVALVRPVAAPLSALVPDESEL